MKAGTIQPDHMPANKFKLIIVGLPNLTPTTVSEATDETTEAILPDGSVVSGGKTGPIELTVTIPRHHAVEIQAMDRWKGESEDPISPTYRKTGTLITFTGTGLEFKTESLINVWCRNRSTPALDMENDGELTVNSYVLRLDRMIPV